MPFRRHVQQIQLTAVQAVEHVAGLSGGQVGVVHGRFHAHWRASASTWSFIREISGEMTMPDPARSRAGNW